MRNLAIAGMVILTAIMVATFASADSVGIGIKKTAPISGTGSSGSPLKIDVCLSGSAYVSNGTSWACGALGGVTDGDKTDITVSASGATWTIDVAAVTLAKMADLAADTIIGRANGAGTGVPTALTAAQVNTILPVATATVKGLVPTPPNNTTTFLRGDATFAAPPAEISGLTTNTIPKATSATAIGNSSVTDDGTTLTITTSPYVNNSTSKFGGGGGYTFVKFDEVNFHFNTNTAATGYINNSGYLDGTTQFRNLSIRDGKTAEIIGVTGSTKAVTMAGALAVTGAATLSSTLGVTGLSTLTGGFNSSAGPGTVGDFRGTVISPGSLTGTLADWAPTGHATATAIDMTLTGSVDLTGISGGVTGRILVLKNKNSIGYTLVIYDENVGSVAANRLDLAGDTPWTLRSGDSMVLQYLNSRWTQISGGRGFPGLWLTGDLAMGGASITGALNGTFTGTLAVSGNARFYAETRSDGKLYTGGTLQVGTMFNAIATSATMGTCGTSPSVAGGPVTGTITVGTGTVSSCAVNFGSTYDASPRCVATLASNTSAVALYISSASTTVLTIGCISTCNMASATINYHCTGT